MEIIKPPRLHSGDTIGIIAPSIGMKPEYIADALTALTERGFSCKLSANLFSDTDGYAGSVQERADDFHQMILDQTVKMILFGGGEVCNEILPYIDWDAVRRHPKILCSYSDSTSILDAVTSQTGLVTFYGQSLRTFAPLNSYNWQVFRDRFMNPVSDYASSSPWKVICSGSSEGVLTGGYLVNYAALFGLPWFRLEKETKYLLFLEDHEKFSNPAAVSKWLTHLDHRGIFRQVSGLIFGHYSTNEQPFIDEILARVGVRYHIPVVRCDDFGHGRYNAVYPIGIRAKLDTTNHKNIFTFLENSVL